MDDLTEQSAGGGLDEAKQLGKAATRQAGKAIKRGAKAVGRKVGKKLRRAAKDVGAKAAKAAAQLIVKIAVALGPIAIAAAAFLLLFSLAYVYEMEDRGSTQSNVLDPSIENPTYQDPETGAMRAYAQTEPQAVVDAYYKYMSTASYVKSYKDTLLEFQDPNDTQDLAGLRDYHKAEENFYLSDDFIRQLDELLHDKDFYYPEQIIKPVYGQRTTLYDENGGEKTVYVSRLPYDTPDGERMYDEKTVKGFDEMLNGGVLAAPNASGSGRQLLARSQVPEQTVNSAGQERYKLQDRNVVADDFTGSTEPGLWDYGFASVLEYQPDQKLMYITCQYDFVDVDFDYEYYNDALEEWIHVHGAVETMPVSGGLDALRDACRSYCDEREAEDSDEVWHYHLPANIGAIVDPSVAWNMAAEPNAAAESNYSSIYRRAVTNSHIDMEIKEAWDYDIDHLSFNDAVLQSDFGNKGGGLYPIKIALASHAATFSGNTDRTIVPAGQDGCLKVETDLKPNSTASKNHRDPVQTIVVAGTGCPNYTLTAHRTGKYTTELPKITERPSPWGFAYLQDYADHYDGYVPEDIQRDLDLFVRTGLSAEEGTTVKEEYKQNLTFLISLGLLRPYSANMTLSAVDAVSLDDSDLTILAKVIAAEAGPNKLDELMVGAVFMDRVASARYPNTVLGVLTQEGQYACYTDGNYARATPTDREIASAVQVMSGRFAIPENITGQSAEIQGNIYKLVDNPIGYNDHYYCTMGYSEDVSPVDRFGRPALDASQLEELAAELENDTAADASGAEIGGATYTYAGTDGAQIKSNYTLYDISEFDVLKATNMQSKLVQPTSGIIGMLKDIWKSFSSAIEQIVTFFNEAIPRVFNVPKQKESCVRYGYSYNDYDVEAVVYHTITFTSQIPFSTADAMCSDKEQTDLAFIFVGKTGMMGYHSLSWNVPRLVHGVGTSVADTMSPTTAYYAPATPWSPMTGYMELSTPEGTPILAVADGSVVEVNDDPSDPAGRYVRMVFTDPEGDRYDVKLGHLATISTADGRAVGRGDQLGTSTNKTYLSVRKNGEDIDPCTIFYQSTMSAGPSLSSGLYNADGTVDKAAIEALDAELTAYVEGGGGLYHTSPVNPLTYKQCTWWAWGRGLQYIESLGLPITREQYTSGLAWANGGQYAQANVQAKLFNYGREPKPNSLVCYPGSPGHVAYVEAVDYVNKVYYTSDAGSGTHWYGVREFKFGHVGQGSGGTYGQGIFIYLDEML